MRLLGIAAICAFAAVAHSAPAKKHRSVLKPAPKRTPASVVFVIDRSGSMGDDTKLAFAKEAVMAGIDALAPDDLVSLVIFDSESQIVFRERRKSQRFYIKTLVDRIEPGGGTNIFSALKDAFVVLGDKVARDKYNKHVILLTDGEAPSDGIAELVEEMADKNIMISAVGVQGADRNMLAMIADTGNGRLYMLEDSKDLPKLFVRELAR